MTNPMCRYLGVVVLMAVTLTSATYGQTGNATPSPTTEVVVLSTLHQFHEQTPGYSYEDLKIAIERLRPDVLAVELTPTALAAKTPQKIKREYQNAIFPLLESHKWKAVAMEPEGVTSQKLIAAIREAEESLGREFPQKSETADLYSDTLFSYLRARWHSAADVNSRCTDDSFAVKHAFQEKLYGPKEAEGWEGWNLYFLDRIMEAASENPGKRIVVTVGAEHGYWLREHLRHAPGVKLLDTTTALKANKE
ncbi:MAG TPA: hypothetical protein VF135_08385 [Terriglobales bacterium]